MNPAQSTLIKTVAGHELRLTPGNELFIQTPNGSVFFVDSVDRRGLAVVQTKVYIPGPVLRAAGEIQKQRDAALEAAEMDSLAEPPADLMEEEYTPTGDELLNGVEELRFAN